jgi:hypothetical protein
MYFEVIQQFNKTLGNLDAILAKAEAHAAARKFSADNFLTARMAPDMLPFTAQIRIACDNAKGCAAAMAGKVAPKHEDSETTFADMRTRIQKCQEYLGTFAPEDFAQTTATTIVAIPYPPNKAMYAQEALLSRYVPNFYFHVTTAYDLLRKGGVEVGKTDYLGELHLLDRPA